jgi:uncharacterized membrane protein
MICVSLFNPNPEEVLSMTILPNWHPILVHFSIALLSVSVVLFVVSYFVKDDFVKHRYALVAAWNFRIGAVITIFTVLAGWYAYNTVGHNAPSHAAMTVHRNWALATFAWLVLLTVWLFVLRRRDQQPTRFFVAGSVILLAGLAVTGWHGGELVYRYGLGVLSMPAAERSRHDHGHGHDDHADEPPQRHEPSASVNDDTSSSQSGDFGNAGHGESHSAHDHNTEISRTADKPPSDPEDHDSVEPHAH